MITEPLLCGRCREPIESGSGEDCWFCHADICAACWDSVGHCGHPEAERENERARAVPQPAVKA